jgi:hypothetical protein
MNISDCDDLEIDGVDAKDAPEFVDAYFSSGTLNGEDLTDDQLDYLTDNYPEVASEMAYMSLVD